MLLLSLSLLFTGYWSWLLWRGKIGGSDKVLQREWWTSGLVFDDGGHLAKGETEILKKQKKTIGLFVRNIYIPEISV